MYALSFLEIPVGKLHGFIELTWNGPSIFYGRKSNDIFVFLHKITKYFRNIKMEVSTDFWAGRAKKWLTRKPIGHSPGSITITNKCKMSLDTFLLK